MKKIIILLTFILYTGVVLGLSGDGSAANPYYGNLTGNYSFGPGIVYINGTISTSAYTLTIQPGTTLRLYSGVNINVQAGGKMIADGTEASKITFTADNNTDWGHLYFYNSHGSVFDNCIFEFGTQSMADGNGGAMDIAGGSDAQVTYCLFRNNVAFHGGGIRVSGSYAEISDCVFEGNTGYRGSAIFLIGYTYTPVINRCRIYSNHATDRSAVHGLTDASALIQNSLIYNNTCVTGGGGVNFGGTTEGSILVNIINCVIVNNENIDVYFRGSARFSVLNSIIWGSSASVHFDADQTPRTFNLVNCAAQGAYLATTELVIEEEFTNSFTLNSDNSATDGPNFTDPLNDDFSITFLSPCRDMGTSSGTPAPPVTDILGNSRIGDYDIGAYEVQYSRWTGATDNEWSASGNWVYSLAPASADNVVIPDVTNDPGITDYQICSNLIIDPSAILTVEAGGALTVDGDLTNDGSLIIESAEPDNSGSLIVNGTGTGLVTYNRQLRTQADAGDYHYFSSPVAGQVITDFVTDNVFGEPSAQKVANVWEWDETIGDWPLLTSSTNSFVAGKGYNLAQNSDAANDGKFAFTGTINGLVNITGTAPYDDPTYEQKRAEWGGGGWNLLGNPYTSAIDGVAFVDANSASFDANYEAVYLYSGDEGTRGVYRYIANPGPGEDFSGTAGTDYIQAGQGFFVLAHYDGVTFSFTPGTSGMQTHQGSVEMMKSARAEKPWPGLRLRVNNGTTENQTTIVYDENMTRGLDPGYDVGELSAGPEIDIYTTLVEDDGVNFTRQALPISDCEKKAVAVGLDFEKGGEVTFSAYIVPLGDCKFYLEDRLAGLFTDLGTDDYTVTLPAKTYGTGRFFLHASPNPLTSVKDEDPDILAVRIWASDGIIIIQGPVSEESKAEIFDMQGHKISDNQLEGGDYNYLVIPSVRQGVYIVRIIDGIKVYTQKVILL